MVTVFIRINPARLHDSIPTLSAFPFSYTGSTHGHFYIGRIKTLLQPPRIAFFCATLKLLI